MHKLEMEELPYWMRHLPEGTCYGRCACGLSFTGKDEAEVKAKWVRHADGWSTVGRCGFCGGPTPCLRDD